VEFVCEFVWRERSFESFEDGVHCAG